jgi:hypothetical protein
MKVGGYALDLYCDLTNPNHEFGQFPEQFVGKTLSECKKEAREKGWIIRKRGKDTCPKCSKKARKND